jgi:hypothetical protein
VGGKPADAEDEDIFVTLAFERGLIRPTQQSWTIHIPIQGDIATAVYNIY